MDFLFGLSDDWEIGVVRGVQGFVLDAWEKARERDLAALVRLHQEIAAVSTHITTLADDAREVGQGLDIVRTRNPEFIDMPADQQQVRQPAQGFVFTLHLAQRKVLCQQARIELLQFGIALAQVAQFDKE